MEDASGGNLIEDMISSDLALRFIRYLNVADSGRLACSSQRFYYLVHQFRRLKGPEIVTTTARTAAAELEMTTPGERTVCVERISRAMLKKCKQKLQGKPNLVFGFSAKTDFAEGMKKELLFPHAPNNSETVSLHAVAYGGIQAIQPASSQGLQAQQPELDCECEASLMAMNFPGATILPFAFSDQADEDDLDFLEQRLRYHSGLNNGGNNNNNNNNNDDGSFWKGMILYAVGGGVVTTDSITRRMQMIAPNAVIVGGVCGEGYVSMPTYTKAELCRMSERQLQYALRRCCYDSALHGHLIPKATEEGNSISKSELVDLVHSALEKEAIVTRDAHQSTCGVAESGIFGVVLGGDVPIRSTVSRGVQSVLNNDGPPRSFSNLVVHEAHVANPGGGDSLSDVDPSFIHITTLRDQITGELHSPIDILGKYLPFDFLGIKRRNSDGFQLSALNQLIETLGVFAILRDGFEGEMESVRGAEVDFFCLRGKACMDDMDRTMRQLQQQTEGKEILGALMYTCNGRGPEASYFIPEAMSDAKRFARAFPDVPCLGFYAGGEFGPVAMAGSQNVFKTGRAALQGFTAVFALFIVPIRSADTTCDFEDSIENVRRFVRDRLQSHSTY